MSGGLVYKILMLLRKPHLNLGNSIQRVQLCFEQGYIFTSLYRLVTRNFLEHPVKIIILIGDRIYRFNGKLGFFWGRHSPTQLIKKSM